MKGYLGCLSLWGMLLAIPVGTSPIRVYSLNLNGASVTVIDAATSKVVHTITSISWPRGAAFSPDGSNAYFGSEGDQTLDVVGPRTFTIIKKIHLSGHPSGSLVITTDGKEVLVPMNPFYGLALAQHDPADFGGVDIIDTTSLERIKTLHIGAVHDIFISPDGRYAIAGSAITSFATVIDLHTFEPIRRIHFDAMPLTMIIGRDPDGSPPRIYAEIKHFNGFEVVDFNTGKKLDKIEFPDTVKYAFAALKNTFGGKNIEPTEYNPTHGTDLCVRAEIFEC